MGAKESLLSVTSQSAIAIKSRIVTCKVPQVTYAFWIIKSCATTVGESLSDCFNTTLGLGLGNTAALFFPLLLLSLVIQFYMTRYDPFLYWIAVVLMSICGTIVTDGFHDNLGIQLWIEVIVFFFLMSGSFGWWYRSQGTLDIHSINSIKREAFYWMAVIFTFALGTAVGDLIAESFNVGYGFTLLIFVVVIIIIFLAWFFFKMNPILSFWFAYIMTRPLGASIGDLLASNQSDGGAGLGILGTSLLFLGIITVLVIYLAYAKVDQIPVKDKDDDKQQSIITKEQENKSNIPQQSEQELA